MKNIFNVLAAVVVVFVMEWSATRWIFTAMAFIIAISVFFFVLSSAGLIGEPV